MVKVSSLCLNTLLGLLIIFPNFSLFVLAKPTRNIPNIPKGSCQATVDKVLKEIRTKGVRTVTYKILKGMANQGTTGNPTKRTDRLIIGLSPWNQAYTNIDKRSNVVISNILGSKPTLKNWSDNIVVNCSNTAIVSFGADQSDWHQDYYIQADGTTKESECVSPGNVPNPLPWGVSICL